MPQVHPLPADAQTVFATATRRFDFGYPVEVRAGFGHHAFYKARTVNRTPPISTTRSPGPGRQRQRQAATDDAFMLCVGGLDERQLLARVIEMN